MEKRIEFKEPKYSLNITPAEAIITLRDIFNNAGYSVEFSNVDIDLKDKAFTVKGNDIKTVRQEAIREVIDTLESEPRMTSSQMARHLKRKFLIIKE